MYQAMERLEGAYSLGILSPSKLLAVRDPWGVRPLCYGRREDGTYVIASESCALPAAGARLIRDVAPGEILVFDEYGVRSLTGRCATRPQATCIFEYLYFARPDSVIDGVSVHAARTRAGPCWPRPAPPRPMWSLAYQTPAWTGRWAMPKLPGCPTPSAL